jgi:hypothetical protein
VLTRDHHITNRAKRIYSEPDRGKGSCYGAVKCIPEAYVGPPCRILVVISAVTGRVVSWLAFLQCGLHLDGLRTYGESCFYLGIDQYFRLILRTPTLLPG